MADIERIRDQLTRTIEGDPWHGLSLNMLLATLSPAEAAARPVENAHTIWELVLHMIAWMDEARARLGGAGRALPPEDDWPAQPVPATDRFWQVTLDRLNESLGLLLAALDDSVTARLDDPIAEGFEPVYHTLYGIIQHNAYHSGQIALIRKALPD